MLSVLSLEICALSDKIKMEINSVVIPTLSLAMMYQKGKWKTDRDIYPDVLPALGLRP